MSEGQRREYLLSEFVDRFGGEVIGDAATLISRVSSLESAGNGDICFIVGAQYRSLLDTTRASAVIVGQKLAEASSLPRIVCDNPYAYYARVCALLNPPLRPEAGVHERAFIAASAQLGAGVCVGPGAVVDESAQIGAGAWIGAGCYVGEGARVGGEARM